MMEITIVFIRILIISSFFHLGLNGNAVTNVILSTLVVCALVSRSSSSSSSSWSEASIPSCEGEEFIPKTNKTIGNNVNCTYTSACIENTIFLIMLMLRRKIM